MIYGSVCSGIECATVAWHPLGWRPAFFSETEKFPRAVLKHRYPDVPLRGDFTEIEAGDHEPIDLLVGGTPCQSFSVAGQRGGLDDERGNLSLAFCRLAQRLRPQWVVWENVPGVLSMDEGRALGTILGLFSQVGYGWAYRVLDAQHFGVPQRRPRVILVGYLGDWRPAAEVLFEPACLSWDPAKGAEAGEIVAGLTESGVGTCGADDNRAQAGHLIPIIPVLASGAGGANGAGQGAAAFAENSRAELRLEGGDGQTTSSLKSGGGKPGQSYPAIIQNMAVRRLTPVECERLQGLPDNWTAIPWKRRKIEPDEADYYRGHGLEVWNEGGQDFTQVAPDGPRYKAIGNGMAVLVMRWAGERVETVVKAM